MYSGLKKEVTSCMCLLQQPYTYNKSDQSIKTYDKVNGLSDTDIRFIAWNKTARRLVILYSNNNIDLLDDRGNVTNVPDYYLKTTMADKTVNGIDMSGAYVIPLYGFWDLSNSMLLKQR